jgi:hypothetical protein
MKQHPYKRAEDRYECRTLPRCYKSVKVSELESAVLVALEESELPALKLKVKNGDGNALKIQQNALAKLQKQLADFHEQEDKQFELLETGQYTQDIFERRHSMLRAKIEECQSQIYKTKQTMPREVDYAERVRALEDAIAMFKDADATPEEKNKMLKAIVERIEFTGDESLGVDRKGVAQQGSNFSIKVFLRI